MEEFASIIPAIIIIVISIASSAAKSKQKQQRQNPHQPVSTPVQSRPAAPVSQPAAAVPVPAAKPAMAQPTVHPHLSPDCDTHDAPTSGSLNVVSSEGKDPCHEDQLPKTRSMMPPIPEPQPALSLDWSGESMVKAFVMQEVLTRPCDRRR